MKKMPQSTNSTNGRHAAEASESASNPVPDHGGQAGETETFEACCNEATRFIQERPLTSVMALFGAGLGAGVAVGCLLSRSSSTRRSSMADEIGRSIVDSISRVMPDSLSGKS